MVVTRFRIKLGDMPSAAHTILNGLAARFVPGKTDKTVRYYFSVGEDKYTMVLSSTACTVTPGRDGDADCVVKAHPDVFSDLVLKNKAPGPLDIARGRFKTNDPGLLMLLKDCFKPL